MKEVLIEVIDLKFYYEFYSSKQVNGTRKVLLVLRKGQKIKYLSVVKTCCQFTN